MSCSLMGGRSSKSAQLVGFFFFRLLDALLGVVYWETYHYVGLLLKEFDQNGHNLVVIKKDSDSLF